MSLSVLCYRVGWEARGWRPDVSLLAVPAGVRRVLIDLARADGLPDDRSPLAAFTGAWVNQDLRGKGLPAPLDDAPLRKRLGVSVLERVFPEPLRMAENEPWRWRSGTHTFDLNAHRLLNLDIHCHLRRLARKLGLTHRPLPIPAYERWTHIAPLAFRLWSMFWLRRLEWTIEQSKSVLNVLICGDTPLPLLALNDALALASAVNRLYSCGWALPEIVVDAPDLSPVSEVACRQGETSLERPMRGIVREADVELGDFEIVGDHPRWWSALRVRNEADQLENNLARPMLGFHPENADRAALDHLFGRYFPHPAMREEQYVALRRLLQGESLLVLLPTGFGKSLIFQFAALIQPATAVVIAPLKALIDDQLRSLSEAGIGMVDKIVSDYGNRENGLARLKSGKLRLCYITPERLQQKSFRDTIEQLIGRHRFSLIALDEAHCLSEWGHDFRPAFHHVRALRRWLLREQIENLPMLALTATASRAVRAELLPALDIPMGNIVQTRSSDRPEISLSVHPVADVEQRAALLSDLVKERVASMTPDAFGRYPGGVLVFAPFADSHEPGTYRTSVPAIHDDLKAAGLEDRIGLFTAEGPRSCPKCGSHRYQRNYGKSICDNCEHHFLNKTARKASDWEAKRTHTQEQFIGGQLPVLVATKGFGMGVDKPDIRLVVHQVMAGSLEGYYQEAGRAGRDGRHAHAALIVVPPAKDCIKEHIREDRWRAMGPEEEISLPCLKRNQECPYGLKALCDFGQQASLIQMNFPGLQSEWRQIKNVYIRLLDSSVFEASEKKQEEIKALTRLQQLGVIESFVQSGSKFDVQPTTNLTPALIADHLEAVLRTFLRGGRLIAEAARIRSLPMDEAISCASRLLLEAIYTVIRGSRLASLLNLHRYATLPQGECRRAYLQQHFDVATLGRQGSCGFCDNCVPDRKFERERAIVPEARPRDEELSHLLMDRLDQDDLEGVAEVVAVAITEGYADALRARAGRLLEERPGEASVLFFAALTRRQTDRNSEAAIELTKRALAVLDVSPQGMERGLTLLSLVAAGDSRFERTILCADENPLVQHREARRLLIAALKYRRPKLARYFMLSEMRKWSRVQAELFSPDAHKLFEEFLSILGSEDTDHAT